MARLPNPALTRVECEFKTMTCNHQTTSLTVELRRDGQFVAVLGASIGSIASPWALVK